MGIGLFTDAQELIDAGDIEGADTLLCRAEKDAEERLEKIRALRVDLNRILMP